MWDWLIWKATIWMWAAIFGDILIVLGVWKIVTVLAPSIHVQNAGFKGYAFLLVISFTASIFLESLAIALNLWQYSPNMPAIELFDYHIGLSPILQITFLPALSVYLAEKSTRTFNRNTN